MRYVRCVAVVAILAMASTSFAAIGKFQASSDVGTPGDPLATGATLFEGFVFRDSKLVDQYVITAGGSDIWGTADHGHFAYRVMTGDVRVSASGEWVIAPDWWSKWGVMIRASLDADAVNYYNLIPNNVAGNNRTQFQWRETTGAGSAEMHRNEVAQRLGIQRVTVGAYTLIEGIGDFGNGWESIGLKLASPELPDTVLVGVASTAHRNNAISQARIWDVQYEKDPALVAQLPVVPAAAAVPDPQAPSGFNVRTVKAAGGVELWSFDDMNALLDGNLAAEGEGSRQVELVNLYDSGGRGAFSEENGFADETFPFIDTFESPAGDPANGDDENDFATEVTGIIYLTEGLHVIGANSDDGTVVEIGGVQVGATEPLKGPSNRDFFFLVEAEGFYPFRARSFERGGGASLELHEILPSGARILLNDTAAGGSPVFVPEPATVALFLPAAAFVLLRRRRG